MSNLSVQPTSLEAFIDLDVHLSKREREVFQVFQRNPESDFTDFELAQKLGWKINCVTPRRHSLVKKELVEKSDLRKNSATSRRNIAWRLDYPRGAHQEMQVKPCGCMIKPDGTRITCLRHFKTRSGRDV